MNRVTKIPKARIRSRNAKRSKSQTEVEKGLLVAAWKETLAELGPGMAHDFNNILTGIQGISETLLIQITPKNPLREGLSLIVQQVQHASRLTHYFARLHQESPGKGALQDINSLVREIVELLHRVFPKRIELRMNLALESLPIHVDAVEFRRAVLALILHSVAAMPEQGKVVFETFRHKGFPEGLREKLRKPVAICLRIGESGSGITREQVDSWLDPGSSAFEFREKSNLGWYLARTLIEKNGGAVSVEHHSSGNVFGIWLPEADLTSS